MMPTINELYQAIDGTWPAARIRRVGPWLIREGNGGGQRVSAATVETGTGENDIAEAEAAMLTLNQPRLFMIRQGDDALDRELQALGYDIVDPVNIYCERIETLAAVEVPPVTAFCIWEPLAIMLDIWAQGGIGKERVAVMDRAKGAKTAIFGRSKSRPAATAFVAVHGKIAMVHALEVLGQHRRENMGRHLTHKAAQWAEKHGVTRLAVLCTKDNLAANALYSSIGMTLVGQYHYRRKG